jgi:hypothetical protein
MTKAGVKNSHGTTAIWCRDHQLGAAKALPGLTLEEFMVFSINRVTGKPEKAVPHGTCPLGFGVSNYL